MIFSKRTNWSCERNPLIARFEALRSKREEILDLTESNPTKCALVCPSREILSALSDRRNIDYAPSPRGDLAARRAICRFYQKKGYHIRPEQIFVTASTSEAYAFVFRLLLNEQEQVLSPRPSYPLVEFLSQLNDVQLNQYPLEYENQWSVDLDSLEAAVTAKTRVLIAVNPNNPTGSYLKKDELCRINQICRKNNLVLVCDEVFSDYCLSEKKDLVLSCCENKSVLTFSFQGASKTLGLPQMKVGWMVLSGPDRLVAEAARRLEVIADTYLSVNIPAMRALESWLRLTPQIQKEIFRRLKNNQDLLSREISSLPSCRCLPIEGGWYAVVELPAVRSEDEWSLTFLERDHVFVHPGYYFDFERGCHIVLSLLVNPVVFQKGLRRIFQRIGAIA